jgi:hypothetical protein
MVFCRYIGRVVWGYLGGEMGSKLGEDCIPGSRDVPIRGTVSISSNWQGDYRKNAVDSAFFLPLEEMSLLSRMGVPWGLELSVGFVP